MPLFFERVDAASFLQEDFSFDFESWVSNMIDTINEALADIENGFNTFVVQGSTQAEIVAAGPDAEDGTIWYAIDSVPPNVVIKIDGALRQLTTSAYP